jgi:DUF1365 family protein
LNERPDIVPPQASASIYRGTVMHARMKPVTHRFTYRVFSLLIDVDALAQADKLSPVFSVARFNLLSFAEKDHGPRNGTPLRPYVEKLLAGANVDLRGGRILLLCYPRILGFVFNPLSVYYCYDDKGHLAALLYEVRNTFGEMHSYVAPIETHEIDPSGIKQERDKLFYVSPFLDMTMRYHFRLQPPGETLRVRILEKDQQGPILAATFSGTRQDVNTKTLLQAFFSMPLLSFKIVAAIHWEAARLWVKGLRLTPRPAPPSLASYRDASRAVLPDPHP